MIKLITIVHRKAGMSHDEFDKYWLEKHPAVFAKHSPGVKRYVQNHFVQLPGVKYEGDGIVELWFEDIKAKKAFDAYAQTKEAKPLGEDADKFLDMSKAKEFLVDEHVIFERK